MKQSEEDMLTAASSHGRHLRRSKSKAIHEVKPKSKVEQTLRRANASALSGQFSGVSDNLAVDS